MWQLRRHICNTGFCLHNHRPLSPESTHIDFSILHERRDGQKSQKPQLTKPIRSENTLGGSPIEQFSSFNCWGRRPLPNVSFSCVSLHELSPLLLSLLDIELRRWRWLAHFDMTAFNFDQRMIISVFENHPLRIKSSSQSSVSCCFSQTLLMPNDLFLVPPNI